MKVYMYTYVCVNVCYILSNKIMSSCCHSNRKYTDYIITRYSQRYRIQNLKYEIKQQVKVKNNKIQKAVLLLMYEK